MNTELIALVPAAGIGSRALRSGQTASLPKQYQLLNGEPMLRHAVRALLADPRIAQVRVVVAANDPWADAALQGLARCVVRSCGGPSRAHTVLAGLLDAALPADAWVLVHDAARPGLPRQALNRLVSACLGHPVGGLLAMPVPDTVKRQQPPGLVSAEPRASAFAQVQGTIDRTGLWLAQTPQMFRAGALCAALQQAGPDHPMLTDEASAMELAGYHPLLVPGSARNFKVTWPDDFELMQHWLALPG
ncbi:MAG: 2-C-methyl-D-erythritol 4-phosphate cytidylyltransferase [Alcaligenaceae bacterium]|nr:2-C-methyl-D-erythritol 4-phosphate cytidylyltransferase [Alcaligenaceae bacterium]